MAAGVMQEPGTEYGPCSDPCEHRDCALTRQMAGALCPHCREPIGYGVRYYRVDRDTRGSILRDSLTNSYSLAHARCEEGAA